jgi:hypothetical protein
VNAGVNAAGTPCDTNSQCAVGLECRWGACRQYCEHAGAACAGGASCYQENTYEADGGVIPIPNRLYCPIACKFYPDSCASGLQCYDFTYGPNCETSWADAGLGQTCSTSLDCARGLDCVGGSLADGGAGCAQWCRTAQNDCAVGQTCQPFQKIVVVDGVEFGFCGN